MSTKVTARLATAGCAAILAVTSALAGAAGAHAAQREPGNDPLLVQTDDPSGNSVVVYHRNDNGTLAQAGTYGTGGLGGILGGADVDHLGSQGSLAYDRVHHLLYAVNAGSDTVTVFTLHGDLLRRVQVIGSGGTFPVSVTLHGATVYVLNARDGGSIQGFVRLGDRLIRIPRWHRALGLDSTLTPEGTSTPGQVAFTPAGDKLVVTTKNNGNQIDVFNLDPLGRPSDVPVVTPEPGTVPFSVAFDGAGHLDVAEAAGSVATFAVRHDGSLALIGRQVTQQQATCWITSTRYQVIASNTGSGTLSSFAAGRDGLTALGRTATDAAPTDTIASPDGRYLYVRTGVSGDVDEFAIGHDGTLRRLGSVPVPGGAGGGEGIAVA